MVKSSRARQVLLAVTGLAFALIATGSLIAPAKMAEPFRYALAHVDSFSEYRAIYVGLWGAHVAACALAIRRVDNAALGDIIGMLVLGQSIGRMISLVLDGVPTMAIWPIFIVEFLGGAAILLIRPSPPR